MQKFITSTVALLLPLSLLAQLTITGFVRDERTQQPLPGAIILLDGTNQASTADEFGRYVIEGINPGTYTVLIKLLGYEEKSASINLTSSAELNFTLSQTAILTDAVVVSSTRASDKTPTTHTTVGKDKIAKQNFGQDLPFVLNWTPSVVTTSDAGTGFGYTGIRVRGSDGTRINVTINGIPYNDSESLGTFWVDIPDIASSSQSIQVQRGVGTSTNGAGAFGASINLQTNTKNDLPEAEIINSFGSFSSRRHTLNFSTGLLNKHWILDGRVSRIKSDGYIDRANVDVINFCICFFG